MAEENLGASPELTPMQARVAKAKATREANKAKASATERVTAPDTVTEPVVLQVSPPVEVVAEAPVVPPQVVYQPPPPPQPRQMRVERQGAKSEPYTQRFPQVRGGICEYCGVLDPNVQSQNQYKLCGHYRGMQLRCSYCPETKDPDEVVYHSNLNIASHPDNPNTLIVWCDSFNCSDAHLKRFQRAKA